MMTIGTGSRSHPDKAESFRGQATLEYTMILGLMVTLSILVSGWLIDALRETMGLLAFKTSIYLTSFPQ
ncbi:MAG: hypothetical protein ACRD1X_07825 [Vicinamibacteria bacterium]